MKCHHCGQEGDHRFLVSMMGYETELYLCSDCLRALRDFARHMIHQPSPVRQVSVREMGDDSFPLEAEESFKRRRKIFQLKALLQEAVEREEYEQAAVLRDQINTCETEEGICIHDT